MICTCVDPHVATDVDKCLDCGGDPYKLERSLDTIVARIEGRFDYPPLVAMGTLGTINEDVLRIVEDLRKEIDTCSKD